jgi:hypothetical protein
MCPFACSCCCTHCIPLLLLLLTDDYIAQERRATEKLRERDLAKLRDRERARRRMLWCRGWRETTTRYWYGSVGGGALFLSSSLLCAVALTRSYCTILQFIGRRRRMQWRRAAIILQSNMSNKEHAVSSSNLLWEAVEDMGGPGRRDKTAINMRSNSTGEQDGRARRREAVECIVQSTKNADQQDLCIFYVFLSGAGAHVSPLPLQQVDAKIVWLK